MIRRFLSDEHKRQNRKRTNSTNSSVAQKLLAEFEFCEKISNLHNLKHLKCTSAPKFIKFHNSRSMKNGLETRQSQRTSVLSSIIKWKVCWTKLKMTVHSHFDWLKQC